MPPPELPRDAPRLDVAHPFEIGLVPVLGHKHRVTFFNGCNRGLGERGGIHIPLLGEPRLDNHFRTVTVGHLGEAPVLVLSDDNASVPHRTARAGRVRDEDGLTAAAWDAFARRAERVAAEVRDAAGLRTVFHHHCAGYVETPREIDALMSRTDPSLLGLCLDTGHLTFAGGDPIAALAAYSDRIWHVHFKDCEPALAARSRVEGWDYHTSVRRGIFCELGRGTVPFAGVLDALRARRYDGWIVVEQDVLPGLGTPAASASRNRAYLRRLGL